MKEEELRSLAVCKSCGKKLGASFRENHTLPIFWKVTLERHLLDDGAMRRQAGLEMMVGHVGIARALSPDEDMTKQLMDPVTVCICEHCALNSRLPIMVLAEPSEEDETEEARLIAGGSEALPE